MDKQAHRATPVAPDELLEREGEFAALAGALDEAFDGRGALVAVEGAAGIGKTRLLSAMRDHARGRGMRVLAARGSELEREYPFGVVRQALDRLVLDTNPDEREPLLAGAAAPARALLFGDELYAPAPDAAFATMRSVFWLLAQAALSQPLVITIDDVHWADAPTLRLLHFLSGRIADLPLLIVIARRSSEPGPNSELLEELSVDAQARLVSLEGLSPQATGVLVERRLGRTPDAELVVACHDVTHGNPFYLHGLLAEIDDSTGAAQVRAMGPRGIARSVLVRLGRTSPAATATARALSVLGDGASVEQIAALADLTAREAEVAALALEDAGLITLEVRPRFVHPVVRASIYEDQAAGTRDAAHARAATQLIATGAPAEQAAAQATASSAPLAADLLAVVRDAAREAVARGAPDIAVGYLRRAADDAPPESCSDVLAEFGSALLHAGDATAAASVLTEAHALATEPAARGGIAPDLGRARMMSGQLAEAIAGLDEEIAELAGSDRDLALRLEVEAISAARFEPAARRMIADRLERLRPDVTGDGPGDRRFLAHLSFEMALRGEPVATVVDTAVRALSDGALLAAEGPSSPVYYLPVWALVFSDAFAPAQRELDAALEAARFQGSQLGFALGSALRAALAYRSGRIDEAETYARQALEREDAAPLDAPLALAVLVDALVDRDDLDGAVEAIGAGELDSQLPEFPLFGPLNDSRGRLRFALGDVDGAIDDFEACGLRAIDLGSNNPIFAWRSNLALALTAGGDGARAASLAAEELELAERFGGARGIGLALRTSALVETDPERRVAMLRASVDALDGSPAVLELSRSLLELGAAIRRGGRRADARAPLERARGIAARCGAARLVRRATEELQASGARPRRLGDVPGDGLTASERRVAHLAAEGRSNAEIAQDLFVTVKTVEMHLSNAYRKLGIARRGQLSRALAATVKP